MADAQLKEAQREGLWLRIRYRFFELTTALLLNEHPEHTRAAHANDVVTADTLTASHGRTSAGGAPTGVTKMHDRCLSSVLDMLLCMRLCTRLRCRLHRTF